ncbi:alpha/beta hydrolase [Mycolicibacterium sp. 018/SC-01/001]|uniref:alpha/beta fold hydrolase n=1 Tax=Mycolicibacterium sp. 018/SC-01/001 TaxID=2592069 RepID=UPI00117D3516|nr:alpha/beta hydrolase [Mycolicibacterium sp. 018/SC-01/001]TRW88297.1 alpha/beta hydrolase [Mycolicibacterium sp. 018/SC-01/001]
MDLFDEWQRGGTTFTWESTTPANAGRPVEVFARRTGTPGAPALVCVHGFPTASIDFHALAADLAGDMEIFTLDFPGYGISDKPGAPYVYSLYDDARLLQHAITDVWGLGDYRMITHDRGSSVGMIALPLLVDAGASPREVFLTNANIFLPLANLTAFQVALLDDATARATAAAVTPEMLAAGLGATTFMPRRDLHDREIAALAHCFAHNDGIAVLPDTIRYLHERTAGEQGWLERLSGIDVDTTLIWGLHDSVAPLRVATHVWQTHLRSKPGRNRFWVIPGADHYVQSDAPAELAEIIRLTATQPSLTLQTLDDRPDGAVLVDQSDNR